jgi:hypothetical protein
VTTDVLADLPATHQALLSAPLCERGHRVPKVRFCPKSKLVRDGTGTWLSQVYLYQHLCLQVSTAENQHQCAHFTEQSTSHTYTPSPERPRLALHLELKTNGTTFHLVSSAGGHILDPQAPICPSPPPTAGWGTSLGRGCALLSFVILCVALGKLLYLSSFRGNDTPCPYQVTAWPPPLSLSSHRYCLFQVRQVAGAQCIAEGTLNLLVPPSHTAPRWLVLPLQEPSSCDKPKSHGQKDL